MQSFDFLESSLNWLPLADAVAKATILLATAALVTTLLRKSSAATRHLVWTCALLAALALPLLSIALPRWQVPLITLPDAGCGMRGAGCTDTASNTHPPEGASTLTESGPHPQRSPRTLSEGNLHPQRKESAPPAKGVRTLSEAPAPSLLSTVSWPTLLGITWTAGAVLVLGRLVLGLIAVHWMSRRTRVATDAPWLPLARELASRLGLARVTFRRSEGPAMPMAWGVFRPSVLIPAEADDWPRERLRIVLLHELAHVRRADCLTHILAQAACALYWMNPLAWIAARRIRAERERACDDLVLACGTAGPDYADQLLEIARTMGRGRLSATMTGASLAMARRSQLEGRLMSILDPSVPRTGVSRVRTAAATTVALLTLVPLASLQTWTRASPAVVPLVPVQQTSQGEAATQAPQTEVVGQRGYRLQKKTVSQEVVKRTVQGATEGALQGVTQGVLEGVLQGVLQSIPAAMSGALEATMSQSPNPNPNPTPRAENQASKADPKVVAALTEALKDSDKDVRESAMHALVQMRDPGIFEPLLMALKDASPDVRESAAFGLGQLRDKRAAAPLSGALKDASAGVREQAVFALGQLRDPATVDALAGALRDASAAVREQAAFALGQLRARSAVDALIAATRDADADVRAQAAFALGQTRDPRAIDALTAALEDASADVRQQAAFALGQLAR